jgi:hypothetical protein
LALSCLSVSVCPSSEWKTHLPLEGFLWNWCSRIFKKSVEKVQGLLKYDKNYGYSTWRPIYIYDNILFRACNGAIVLRYCASCWKATGSIPDGVTGIFHWRIPSSCTIALGLTQPLTDMSTRNIFWGVKVAGSKGWWPCNLHMLIILKSGRFNLLEPLGPFKACTGIDVPLLIWMCEFWDSYASAAECLVLYDVTLWHFKVIIVSLFSGSARLWNISNSLPVSAA